MNDLKILFMMLHGAETVDAFLVLLRAGMYGLPVPEAELPEAIDWEAVVALARRHAVFGIIIDGVQFLPERLRPSGSVAAEMARFAMGLIQANRVLDMTVAKVVRFLHSHGVGCVLLKGQGVARYYRMPLTRQTGDIDLYVPPAVYKKAVNLCLRDLVKDRASCSVTEKHFAFYFDGVEVELHHTPSLLYVPLWNRRFQKWVGEQLDRSSRRRTVVIGDCDVAVPSYGFDAVYIFQHAWNHFITGGIGLRQLCDWAMVFHSHAGDIDTTLLIADIRRFGLTAGWRLFAYIAVRYLGVPEDSMPLYDPSCRKKAESILAQIIDGGNFGYHAVENSRIFERKYGLLDELHKSKVLARDFFMLFPLVPAEATFLFLRRMSGGLAGIAKRMWRRWSS